MKKKIGKMRGVLLLTFALFLTACGTGGADAQSASYGNSQAAVVERQSGSGENESPAGGSQDPVSATLDNIPAYSGTPYVVIDDNEPDFTEDELTDQSYESYSDLDELGRCGVAASNIGTDLMPTGKRGKIGQVKPSGWQTIKFDNVDGKYLYNRCHLIGYQLSAENANTKNLITGTRYINTEGMLPFENMVADYVKETNQHVLYRVTPVFTGENLVADGVLMEGKSVEDNGEGILFCVFAYNVQPGVSIDYATGESVEGDPAERLDSSQSQPAESGGSGQAGAESEPDTFKEREAGSDNSAGISTYILNTNTMKFHREDCSSVKKMSEKNKAVFEGTRQEAIDAGYAPCENCNP